MNIFKGRGRDIAARAIGVAIVIFVVGLIFGKLDAPYFCIGVFVMSNAFMLLDDIFKYKTGNSFIGLLVSKLGKKERSPLNINFKVGLCGKLYYFFTRP